MNKVKLGEIIKIYNGKAHQSLEKVGTTPVFGSGGLMGYTNDLMYEGEAILLPRKGTLANIQYLNGKFWVVDTTYYAVVDKEKANTYFVWNYLKILNLGNLNSGSAVPSMTQKAYQDIEINLPNLPTQTAIARVLSSLDNKIELNNKINKELENLAKTIYEYWFVQNAEESWERKKIGEIAEVIRGTMITAKQTKKGNVKVVAGGIDFSYTHSEFNREKNTITVSGSGANAGFVNFWREKIFASDCTTVRGETDFDTILIYWHLIFNQDNIYRLQKGAAQPHIYPSDIKEIWFYDIPQSLKDKFNPTFIAINEQIAKNQQENAKLTQLRDFLLPLLMNGQVTVVQKLTINGLKKFLTKKEIPTCV